MKYMTSITKKTVSVLCLFFVIITVLSCRRPPIEPDELFVDKSFTINEVSFKMIAVKGGTFMMGGTPEQGADAFDWELPVHQVTLSDYYVGQTEVTQELWKAVMRNNPSYFHADCRPVENVSWDDCQEFIKKLNVITGEQFRLLTEAELEYAARGGNKSMGYKYAGSNDIDEVACYGEDFGSGRTHIVGTKKPNELGIYDMSGNVWEWCQDCFGDYTDSPQIDPEGVALGWFRVGRGGSWYGTAAGCRVSNRSNYGTNFKDSGLGLRLCIVP